MRKVSVICIGCESDYIDQTLTAQTYQNLEVVEAAIGGGIYQDIADYCENTDSDYICFLEPGHRLCSDKIEKMVEYAQNMGQADIILCNRNFIEEDNTVVAHPDAAFLKAWKNRLFEGNRVLRVCLESGCNLLGSLTTMMFCRDKVKLSMEKLKCYEVDDSPEMQKTFLLFELLADHIMCCLEEPLADTYVRNYDADQLEKNRELFRKQLRTFIEIHQWENTENFLCGISEEHLIQLCGETSVSDRNLKREITFFYTDKGEYFNLLPIMKCAAQRGYRVSSTDDLNAKAEIGVYCQHFGKPENSKFSVILLHDMAQGHNRWPNIWEKERWNVNKDILDAIEYYTTGEGCTDFMKWKMQGKYMPANMWS